MSIIHEIDITPNKNHTSTTENPGVYGDKNSSVDMTDHGNPKNHPEWPHEHFWDWNSGRPIRK